MGNGIIATITVQDGESVMPYSQTGGYSWTNEYRRQDFNLRPSEGSNFDAYVWNRDTDRNSVLEIVYVVNIPGQTNSTLPTKTLSVNQVAGISVTDNNGNGLSGTVTANLRAKNVTNLYYQYSFNQY